ncbi:MAG: GumC family protein [Vicinamibacterales bacterium]
MSRVEDAYRRLRQEEPGAASGERTPAAAPEVLERYPLENPDESGDLLKGRVRESRGERIRRRARLRPVSDHGDVPRQAGSGLRPPSGGGPSWREGPESPHIGEELGSDPTAMLWGALRVILRRKWVTLAAFGVVFAASVWFLRTLTPVFRATARLTAESRTPADALLKSVLDTTPQQGYLETLAEVLRSRSLAETTAVKLALWQHPEYASLAGGAVPGPAGPAPVAVVERLMARTSVVVLPLSAVVNVSVESTDPQLAAKAANALAEGFIQRDLDSRLTGAQEASAWIGRQLEEQRARVTETEAALQRYRESQNAGSLDERQNIVVQRLGDLNSAVTRARTERIAKEELHKRVSALEADRGQLDSVPVVAANAYVQQLKGQLDQLERQLSEASMTLGERHPEIIRLNTAKADTSLRLSAEIASIIASVKGEYLTALAQEESLNAALESQKREAQDLDRKGVEYAALLREAESNRALYQSLLEQAKNVGMSTDIQRSSVRILDRAPLPRAPINPIGTRGLILAALGSATFAFGLVFLIEFLDPRLRTPGDVVGHLGLPLLGSLEQVAWKEDGGPLITAPGATHRFRESIAQVRTGLEGHAGTQSGVVLIASAGPREGKTLVSSNLALAFALAGRKVLLIDCDLRRSRVHSVFDLPVEPGLTNISDHASVVSLDTVVKQGPLPSLSILTAGPSPANPAEFLGGEGFEMLVEDARAAYDWVIIDSPPVMAVADAQMLIRRADHVVFVACADTTRRNAARLALARLRRAGAPLVGAVLNRVAVPRWAGAYSPYYSGYYDTYSGPASGS